MKKEKIYFNLTSGFTLVEFLIYSVIVMFIMGSLVLVGINVIKGRAKVMVAEEISHNGRMALEKIALAIREAEAVNAPLIGEFGETLSLQMFLDEENPTIFEVNESEMLTMKKGSEEATIITSDKIKIKSIKFTNVSYPNANGSIKIEITAGYNNPSEREEYDLEKTFFTTENIRTTEQLSELPVDGEKADQDAPVAPTMASRTSSSITLDNLSNGEYNIDGGEWQDSITFSGLTAETEYSFTQRYKETFSYFPSPASASASFSTEEAPWFCGDDITDSRDGTVYSTIEIGTQCWTAKNMAYLPSVVPSATGSDSTPYYYVYGYNGTDVSTAKATSNYTTYGVLYNWPAASTACPTDWHLPTDTEWYTLENYLATDTCSASRESAYDCNPAGAKLAGVYALWTNGTLRNHANFGDSGFNAVPSGFRIQSTGLFGYIGEYSDFWSSSVEGASVRRRVLYYNESRIFRDVDNKARGYIVRCVMD
jgi:uncharacterized protein (TIGR02145 family)